MTKKKKLSKVSRGLLEALSSSAQTHGATEACGHGFSAVRAEKHYEIDKAALWDRLAYLEEKNRKLRTHLKFLRGSR